MKYGNYEIGDKVICTNVLGNYATKLCAGWKLDRVFVVKAITIDYCGNTILWDKEFGDSGLGVYVNWVRPCSLLEIKVEEIKKELKLKE